MTPTVAASLGGLTATLPMTIAMEAMFRRLSLPQRYPLPPRAISMRLADAIGVRHELNERERLSVTLLNHFGYGTAAGAVYGLLARRVLSGALGGAVYGLGVWAGSYLGLLPATGLYPPATEESARRNALMIAAHVVWGATLGTVTEALAQDDANP
jgi:uncharacterized membrane protein YagU involved in acid resistance